MLPRKLAPTKAVPMPWVRGCIVEHAQIYFFDEKYTDRGEQSPAVGDSYKVAPIWGPRSQILCRHWGSGTRYVRNVVSTRQILSNVPFVSSRRPLVSPLPPPHQTPHTRLLLQHCRWVLRCRCVTKLDNPYCLWGRVKSTPTCGSSTSTTSSRRYSPNWLALFDLRLTLCRSTPRVPVFFFFLVVLNWLCSWGAGGVIFVPFKRLYRVRLPALR